MNVNPLFLKSGLAAKNIVRRIDDNMRYYYTFADNRVHLYPSITAIIDAVMPTSEYLIKWYADLGYQKAKQIAKEKALYGTLMHICFSDLLIYKQFDLSTLQTRIDTFASENNIDFNTDLWAPMLKDDLAAFYQFVQDFELEPIAIEIPLVSPEHEIAGTIDLIAKIKVGTGVGGKTLKADIKKDKDGTIIEDKRKDIVVLLDWKSGRHSFYASNAAQLHFYKMLWEDNFPEISIDKVFNWSPKDWTDSPTYLLTDQTDSVEKFKLQHYLALFQIEQENKNSRKKHTIEGVIDLDDPSKLSVLVEDLETKLNRLYAANNDIDIVKNDDLTQTNLF